uniref:Phospholipid scramblase n=1 Tax=Myripristis murdjan TaxID=586833 RepID=A0A668AMR6_9TELE
MTKADASPVTNHPEIPVYCAMHRVDNAVCPVPVNHGSSAPPGCTLPQIPVLMAASGQPLGCPPGLEYLTQVDQLLIHQSASLAEMATDWEMNNVYAVKNSLGQQVFVATEKNNILTLQCCGPSRPFTIHLHNNLGQEVLTLRRPLKCMFCCFPCCLQEREPQLKIKGPWCLCECVSDVVFQVTSLDGSAVLGQISKQWAGVLQECFTDADNFGVTFPMDLDVKVKAVILGACFLIDFMFFEKNTQ